MVDKSTCPDDPLPFSRRPRLVVQTQAPDFQMVWVWPNSRYRATITNIRTIDIILSGKYYVSGTTGKGSARIEDRIA